eukprot:2355680-Alexandrium_andersonii.AAC.1
MVDYASAPSRVLLQTSLEGRPTCTGVLRCSLGLWRENYSRGFGGAFTCPTQCASVPPRLLGVAASVARTVLLASIAP